MCTWCESCGRYILGHFQTALLTNVKCCFICTFIPDSIIADSKKAEEKEEEDDEDEEEEVSVIYF